MNEKMLTALEEKHLVDLHASGIPDELIEEAGIRSITDSDAYDLGFRTSRGSMRGMLIQYWDVREGKFSDRFFRLKPDVKIDNRKYLQPSGESCRFYFPPGTTPESLQDTSRPILIVEGEKKALSVEAWRRRVRANYQVIGIGGADAWVRKEMGLQPDGTFGKIRSLPIEDFALVNWRGRRVYLCLDGDVTTNIHVMWAETRLAKELRQRGADVVSVRIAAGKDSKRRGADDLLVQEGDEAWEKVLAAAQPHEGRPIEPNHEEVYAYGDGNFRLSSDGYEKLKEDEEGKKWVRVTNFTITLDEVIRCTDQEANTLFRGHLRVTGRPPRPITLDDKTLADTRLFRTAVYRTEVGLDFPPKLGALIPMLVQRLGPAPIQKVGVLSVGLHGERYVFPSVIIEKGEIRENADCEVLIADDDILKYDLPLIPIHNVPEIAQFVLTEVLPLHHPSVMLPLLGCVGLAPIQHHFGLMNFCLCFVGTTGSGKTLVLKIGVNFYADYPLSSGLPSVTSTVNALEYTGYHLPGLLFVIDDIKRQWLERHASDFVRLLQGTHDRHGRARLNRSATQKQHHYYVRGLLILSGEDFPIGVASSVERTLQITVPADGLSPDFQRRIAAIDSRRGDLRGLTAHYISWLQRVGSSKPLRLWDNPDFLPTDPRMRPYCLLLLTGLHYFFRFLQEEGGISSEILDKHFEDAVRFLAEIAGTTRHDANEQRDDEIFLDSVRELLASGICRLLDDRDPNPHNNAQVIGERNGDLVYLLPAVAIRQVQDLRGTVLNPTSLGRALKERGHLAKLGEKGRPQANERVNGRVARVFVLKASVLFPPEKDG